MRRGPRRYEEKRQNERRVKKKVLATRRMLARLGIKMNVIADLLWINERTLRHWDKQWRDDRLAIKPRGRPLERGTILQRNEVMEVLHLIWPVGMPVLQGIFPDMPRNELEEMLKRYERVHRHRNRLLRHKLTWLVAGSVWAIDHKEAPEVIDWRYPYVLGIRDLATHYQLVWAPTLTKTAKEAAVHLEQQFMKYGPPLAIKMDWGFFSWEIIELARQYNVVILLSPPGLPSYNGSMEAGIGAMTTATTTLAILYEEAHSHWTANVAEGARIFKNGAARPFGPIGHTPDEAWATRLPVTDQARRALREEVDRRKEEILETALQYYPGREPTKNEVIFAERKAISQALVHLGYLKIRSRRISVPKKRLNKVK